VVGEEIGWRGFLQPRYRRRLGLVAASLATGAVWVLWHLPLYLAPELGPGAFAIFAWWVLAVALVMGVVAERTAFSVPIATLLHGAANIASPILLPGVDLAWSRLVTGALYLAAALVLLAWSRRRPAVPADPEPVAAQ
jgi:membrane protease YdiL (CAAX protease family)